MGFDFVEFFDAAHGFVRMHGVSDPGIVKLAARMGSATDLDNGAVKIEPVVTGIRVGLQVASIALFYVVLAKKTFGAFAAPGPSKIANRKSYTDAECRRRTPKGTRGDFFASCL